ncbi:MAG: EamA family transporter [Proteobacteria bacterium]|nr:MAG: EamA family transporter [Pseudomonadota bacterium]
MNLDWRAYALGSAIFAALTAVLAKVGVAHLPSNFATFLRTIVVIAFLAAIVSFRREWAFAQVDRRSALFLVLSGIATGASWLCYFRALQVGPASRVAPVDKLSVVFVMVLAVVFLGESLDTRAIIGGALIAAGSLLLVL